MANKHMERCSTSYIIREMQIKIIRYHYTPIWMAKIWNPDNTKCWLACGATGILIHCWWECKMVQPPWETSWRFFIKLNIKFPYDQTIVLFRIYPKELKTCPHKSCTQFYSSFIHNCQNLEASKMAFSRWMDKINGGTFRKWNIFQH